MKTKIFCILTAAVVAAIASGSSYAQTMTFTTERKGEVNIYIAGDGAIGV